MVRRLRGGGLRSRRVVVVGAYLALLAMSYGVRVTRPTPDISAEPSVSSVVVHAVPADTRGTDANVRLSLTDLGSPAAPGPPLLLIHGSPGSRRVLLPLAELLAEGSRVIVPDLPGFGASTPQVADYSIRAHADYLRQLLDRLDLRSVHIVGYSMGGGVAIALADALPDRVASLTLLSAVGAQEYELLGDYHLNHALHGLQLAAFWLVREATPHMGILDSRGGLGMSYARNFYDSDQRPLRAALTRLRMPVLILHGTHDPLVTYAAALEHARIVPQSELRTFDAGHFMPSMTPAMLAAPLRDFLRRVEGGDATTRDTAAPERVRAAVSGPSIPVPPAGGLTAAIVGALLAAGTALSPRLGAASGGMLLGFGRATLPLVSIGCLAGLLVRGLVSIGRRAFNVSFSRRSPIADAVAGGVGSALRTAFVLVAAWTGTISLRRVGLDASSWPLLIGVLLCLALVSGLAIELSRYRQRRLLVGKWVRWTRWEFWPIWLFYPPIVAYILWLGVRYRGLTLFTAANPGMPGGGFVGESKSDILGRVAVVPDAVPSFALIHGAESAVARRAIAERHVTAHGWPVVVKPDQGQRGAGVTIARSADALMEAVDASRVDTILQRYVPGDEFGVFYYRFPTEPNGHIFAITEKRLQVVVGDGRRTLARLILDHPRAVAIAPFYLRVNAARLDWVPADGERVQLSELGVHSRGAIFYDGARARTPELEAAVDRIGRSVEGFYFGRFDVRAESMHAFTEGRFAVIELNGVTSEATSIYDPGHSLLAAYRVMFAQWRLAFEIGAANRARRVRSTRVRDLVAMMIRYRSVARGHLPHTHQSGVD